MTTNNNKEQEESQLASNSERTTRNTDDDGIERQSTKDTQAQDKINGQLYIYT